MHNTLVSAQQAQDLGAHTPIEHRAAHGHDD